MAGGQTWQVTWQEGGGWFAAAGFLVSPHHRWEKAVTGRGLRTPSLAATCPEYGRNTTLPRTLNPCMFKSQITRPLLDWRRGRSTVDMRYRSAGGTGAGLSERCLKLPGRDAWPRPDISGRHFLGLNVWTAGALRNHRGPSNGRA